MPYLNKWRFCDAYLVSVLHEVFKREHFLTEAFTVSIWCQEQLLVLLVIATSCHWHCVRLETESIAFDLCSVVDIAIMLN